MISYEPLSSLLAAKKITKTQLRIDLNLSSRTLAKFAKNQYVSLDIIDRICKYLDCKIEDVIEYVGEN